MNGMSSSAQILLQFTGGFERQLLGLDDAGTGHQEQGLIQTDVEIAEFHSPPLAW